MSVNTQRTSGGSVTEGLPDVVFRELIAKIADLSENFDPNDPNTQWVDGYSRACGDIVKLICEAAQKQRSLIKG